MKEEPSTVFLFVNYRDYSMLEGLISTQTSIPEDCMVVVVDNTEPNYRDKQAILRLEGLSRVSVLIADNLGYLGAVRYAIAQLPAIRDADFLLVCNTDLEFDLGLFSQQLKSLKGDWQDDRVGIIAPRLVSADGGPMRQQHLLSAPAARKMQCLSRLFSNYFLLVIYKRLGDVKRKFRGTRSASAGSLHDGQELFAPHGALMVFTARYLRLNDAFTFPCFLYCEEVFVGIQADSNRLKCVYDAGLTYKHSAHGSMGSWPSRAIARHLRDAHRWAAEALAKQ